MKIHLWTAPVLRLTRGVPGGILRGAWACWHCVYLGSATSHGRCLASYPQCAVATGRGWIAAGGSVCGWVLWREGQHHQDEGLLSQSQHETAGAFGHWSGYLVGWNHDSKCRFSIHQNGMLAAKEWTGVPDSSFHSANSEYWIKHWDDAYIKFLMICSHLPQRGIYWLRPQLKAGKNPFEVLRNFSEMRGMDFWTDVRDWLGGWPTQFLGGSDDLARWLTGESGNVTDNNVLLFLSLEST